MKILVDYVKYQEQVMLINQDVPTNIWHSLKRIITDEIPQDSIQFSDSRISFAWRYFLSIKSVIYGFVISYQHCLKIELTPDARELLQRDNSSSYSNSISIPCFNLDYVKKKLNEFHFIRPLTENQLHNVCKIGPLPGAATFSVPGAGKTTEALAYFAINATKEDKLLVVAPKNAMGPWDEQISDCFGEDCAKLVRLVGGESQILLLLEKRPRFMIITYEQLSLITNIIISFLSDNSVFVFLDESHRIKGGKGAKRADSVLKLSHLPTRKLIMSGTPMPQSSKDLISQFSFLYPSEPVDEESVTELIQPIYVRTTKKQLGIPELNVFTRYVKMPQLQRDLYESLKFETKRQLIPFVAEGAKITLRKMGKCVIKLMEFVSNPALLSNEMSFIFDQRVGAILLNSDGPKISYVCKRVRELTSQGEKVIVWSSFVQNVELLALRLSDLGAVFIHGGVDAGKEDEEGTREWKIKQFKENPNCKVFIGNPAACSEGISLHMVCQNAIYLDRTFNAAQYLQSADRIHRLGLAADAKPTIEIIECEDSIDQLIEARLKMKIDLMSDVLNDPSLKVEPVLVEDDIDDDSDENEESESLGFNSDDAKEIIKFFFSEG